MNRRSTTTKTTVLEILERKGFALSHEMIQQEAENIDRTTIYRILNRFCEDGKVHRVIDENGKQFFALCKSCKHEQHHHNHLHFKCLSCQKIECLETELEFSLPEFYTVKHFNAMVSGHCNTCAA